MDLMKRIFEYKGTKGPVIADILWLKSRTMIDEDTYEIIDNYISHYDN